MARATPSRTYFPSFTVKNTKAVHNIELSPNQYLMSFDVASIRPNVSVTETINIIK